MLCISITSARSGLSGELTALSLTATFYARVILQGTQATWICQRLSGCRMLWRRWRLLVPLSSMSTSHRGNHIYANQ